MKLQSLFAVLFFFIFLIPSGIAQETRVQGNTNSIPVAPSNPSPVIIPSNSSPVIAPNSPATITTNVSPSPSFSNPEMIPVENKISETFIPTVPEPTPSIQITSTKPEGEELYPLVESGFTHITPFAGSRLTFMTGELAFDSPFGGRSGTDLDLQDDLFVSKDQWGTYLGVDVQHSFFRVNIAYGYNDSDSKGNIPREVIIADSYLQSGARVLNVINTHWFTCGLGYTVWAKKWGGVGVKLSFNYIYIRSSTDVDGYLADDPTNPHINISLDNNVFIPMPTIGGYMEIAFSERWMARGEVDFIYYNIVNRQLTTIDFNFETRYYFSATQNFYGYLKFQYEYFHYKFNTSSFSGYYDWSSFLFLIGAGIKF